MRELVMEGDEVRSWIAKMQPYKPLPNARVIHAVRVPYAFSVVQDGDAAITGTLHCQAGCWLVMSAQSRLYAIPDEVFGRQYEEVVDHEQLANVRRF